MTPDPKPRAEVWRPFPDGETTCRPCRKCGRPIAFGANRVPLDLATLRPILPPDAPTMTPIDTTGLPWEARSHFETCTDPAAFSRGRQ